MLKLIILNILKTPKKAKTAEIIVKNLSIKIDKISEYPKEKDIIIELKPQKISFLRGDKNRDNLNILILLLKDEILKIYMSALDKIRSTPISGKYDLEYTEDGSIWRGEKQLTPYDFKFQLESFVDYKEGRGITGYLTF